MKAAQNRILMTGGTHKNLAQPGYHDFALKAAVESSIVSQKLKQMNGRWYDQQSQMRRNTPLGNDMDTFKADITTSLALINTNLNKALNIPHSDATRHVSTRFIKESL